MVSLGMIGLCMFWGCRHRAFTFSSISPWFSLGSCTPLYRSLDLWTLLVLLSTCFGLRLLMGLLATLPIFIMFGFIALSIGLLFFWPSRKSCLRILNIKDPPIHFGYEKSMANIKKHLISYFNNILTSYKIRPFCY